MSTDRRTELPARWKRFAEKGGIGKGIALCDYVVADTECLNFMKNDEITVLLQIPDREDTYLGYSDGRFGHFSAAHVKFSSTSKKPVKTMRVPTRLSNYSPSLRGTQTPDSDGNMSRLGRFPRGDQPISPASPWIHRQSPYLGERRRCLSTALSSASTTSFEDTSDVYDDYKNSHFYATHKESIPRGSGISPWLSSVVDSLHAERPTATLGDGSLPQPGPVSGYQPQISSTYKPAAYLDDMWHTAESSNALASNQRPTLPINTHNDVKFNSSSKPSPLRNASWNNVAGSSASLPRSPLNPNPLPVLHMPIPRKSLIDSTVLKPASTRPIIQDRSYVAGDGLGNRILVEDDDDESENVLPITTLRTGLMSMNLSASPFDGISQSTHSPLYSPRTPLRAISVNSVASGTPISVPTLPHTTDPAPSPPKSTTPGILRVKSSRNHLISPSKRTRPPSRTASRGLENQASFSGIAHRIVNIETENQRPGSQTIDYTAITRSPSSGKISRRDTNASRTAISTRELYGYSSPSDTPSDTLVFAVPECRSPTRSVANRRFGVVSPPAGPSKGLGVESKLRYRSSMSSLVVDPLHYVLKVETRKRRQSLRVYSSSSSSSCRPSKSDAESSLPSSN